MAAAAAVILAAGGGRRMGGPKALLRWHGIPLVCNAAANALMAGCRPVVVVIGANAPGVLHALAGWPVEVVHNPAWRDGMGGSIAAGVSSLSGAPAGAIVLPVDQPAVGSVVLTRLLAAASCGHWSAVTCFDGERQGPPTWFSRSAFSELAALAGDRGARSVLARHQGRVRWLGVSRAALTDLDRPHDIEALA